MDSSWYNVSTDPATLNQIAQDLGYASADELPSVNSLTGDQVVTLQSSLSTDEMQKFYESSYDYNLPELDGVDFRADNPDLTKIMQEMNAKLSHLYIKFQQENSDNTIDNIRSNTQKTIQKRDEWLKKHEKAKNSSNVSKWLGLAGAIVGVAAAVGVAILTGGATIALVAVAIAIVAAVATGLQASGKMDKMLDSMGVDDPQTRMWVEVGIQAALMIASIATGVGAGSALARMGSEIPTMIATISEVTEVSAEAITAGAKVTTAVTTIVGALLSIGGGTTGIVGASEGYQSTKAQARQGEIQAVLESMQSYLKEIQKELKKAMDRQQQLVWDLPKDVMNSILTTSSDIFATSPA